MLELVILAFCRAAKRALSMEPDDIPGGAAVRSAVALDCGSTPRLPASNDASLFRKQPTGQKTV
jgi:hypothetical protein